MKHPLLQVQLEQGKFSHAYLLEGKNEDITREEGLRLAEYILSEKGENTLLRDKFRHGSLGDFHEIIPKKKRISIEEI